MTRRTDTHTSTVKRGNTVNKVIRSTSGSEIVSGLSLCEVELYWNCNNVENELMN